MASVTFWIAARRDAPPYDSGIHEKLRQDGSPGVIRTPDQRFRKPLLYPSELQGHAVRNHYSLSQVPKPMASVTTLIAQLGMKEMCLTLLKNARVKPEYR